MGRFCGANSPNWKNGITVKGEILRKSLKYKKWRLSVYQRDNFQCQECKEKRSNQLQAHHVFPRRDFPEKIFDINNGVTLCEKCHRETFGKECKLINKFLSIIEQNIVKTTV